MASGCPHNPNPPILGWIPDPRQFWPHQLQLQPQSIVPQAEVCRNFNENTCAWTVLAPTPPVLAPVRQSLQVAAQWAATGWALKTGRNQSTHISRIAAEAEDTQTKAAQSAQ